MNYSEHYLNENAPSDVLNPSVAPSLGVSIQHNFLRGFGAAANARTITVSRMNLNTTELNFKNQVIGLVSQVLNLYYGLAADYEDLRAKRTASETAQTFLKDVSGRSKSARRRPAMSSPPNPRPRPPRRLRRMPTPHCDSRSFRSKI